MNNKLIMAEANKVKNFDSRLTSIENNTTSAADETEHVMTKISEVIISESPVTAIDFTGLDINTDHMYEIIAEIKNTTGVTMRYATYINQDYTDTNYYNQFLSSSGSSVTAGRLNNPDVGYCLANFSTIIRICIKIAPDGCSRVYSEETRGSSSSINFVKTVGSTKDAINNITQIRLGGLGANGFGVGSVVRLYKVI